MELCCNVAFFVELCEHIVGSLDKPSWWLIGLK